jgi:hypothetical protein
MKHDTIGYKNPNIKLEMVYTIEYIDNKPDADKAFSERYDAPWELYKKKKFIDLSDAISLFINMYSRLDNDGYTKIYDVKLFEEINLNGELIQERIVTDIYNFGSIANQESQKIKRQNENLHDTIEYQSNELKSMNSFIKCYHAENAYKQFKEQADQK